MFSRATGAPRFLYLLCAIALLVVSPARLVAQSPGAESGGPRAVSINPADADAGQVNLLVGRSTLLNIGQPIARVSLTRPEIADALVTGTQQLLVHGKAPGTISLFVWDRTGGIKRFDVAVSRDLSELSQRLRQLFPGESITVAGSGKDVIVSGTVTSKYVIEKAAEVAAGYVDKKEDVVNLLRQQEGIATDQVLLRVRFAEVSRSALTELGVNIFSDGNNQKLGSATTQQFAAPFFDQQQPMVGKNMVFSDYLNLFLFDAKNQLGLTIRALQSRGLFQSLAEPNLIAQNGKEASFLAGGEYPYPVVQGSGNNLMVTIVFKEYGIRLNFVPTLLGGDLVHLKVRPEVSTLDFANAVTYQGFRIPALSTRRAETEVELMDGQTFAIAGLLNNSVTSTLQKVPGIGDIPILGLLFRSKSAQKQQSELVVMITPQVLRRGSTGAATGLPNIVEPYLPAPKKTFPEPAPRMPGSTPPEQKNPTEPAPAPAPVSASAPQGSSPATLPASPADLPGAPAGTPGTPPGAPRQGPTTAPPPQGAASRQAADKAPAVVPPPPPSSAAPPIDEKKLAEERRALAKAEARKKEEQKKADEAAARELKRKQEADGRELAKQRELEAKRHDQETKAAEAKKREEAKAAEAKKAEEAKAAEEKRKADIRQAEEQVKAEQARLEAARKQADEARKQEEKAAKERATRDADIAKQAADRQKKQQDAEKKRLKEIQDAVDRLTAAQAAYQAAVERAKKDGGQPHQ